MVINLLLWKFDKTHLQGPLIAAVLVAHCVITSVGIVTQENPKNKTEVIKSIKLGDKTIIVKIIEKDNGKITFEEIK